MLIIRRRSGQSIVIGPDVEIQVIEVGPTQVKLGIVAPDSVTVLRKEVSITRQQNLDAARGMASDRLAALFGRIKSKASGALMSSREAVCQDVDTPLVNPDTLEKQALD